MNYAKLLEISSFFTWHIFLKVGKTQDMPSKIWQTLGDALRYRFLYPVLKNEAKGPGFGVPVQKPVPKALANRYLRSLF